MPHRFQFHDRHVVVTTTGTITALEEAEAVRLLVSSPGFRDGMGMILDNRRREPGADREHIHRVAEELQSQLRRVRIPRMAIVAARPTSFGLGALMEGLAQRLELPMKVQTFSEFENAEAWVLRES